MHIFEVVSESTSSVPKAFWTPRLILTDNMIPQIDCNNNVK